MPGQISKRRAAYIAGWILVAAGLVGLVLYLSPGLQSRLSWRLEMAKVFLRGVVNPINAMPTAVSAAPAETITPLAVTPTLAPTATQTATPAATSTPVINTPTITPSPTPIPASAMLQAPKYEKQEPNSCGPATMAMLLRYWGFEGDQKTISDVIKPNPDDRNVNVEELEYFMLTQATWVESQFRVGGDIATLKALIAGGFPVMIEEGMRLDQAYWPNDDLWAGHYLLLTGYDDATQSFMSQDSYYGADRWVTYETLDHNWKAFNRVYFIVFPADQRDTIKSILGKNWDRDENRKNAVELAKAEIEKDSTDSYAWFNLGTNMVYFEKYQDAVKAYDTARELGLPQRMLRYQFGPFFAYFNTARNDELIALTEYAMKVTPNSEEALLWRGWAFYRKGDREQAMYFINEALKSHPGYPDALYAQDFFLKN